MSIFSAFNNISDTINKASNNFNSFSNTLSSFSNGLGSSSKNFLNSTPLGSKLSRASNVLSSLDSMFANTASAFNIGTATRMATNALQGVTSGANPSERSTAIAVAATDVSSRNDSSSENDWRVSLSVPSEIQNQGILKPLSSIGNRMVFPINPTVMLQHSANYSEIAPTHSNYAFHAYQSSKVDDITLMGEFYIENSEDAAYWLACVHFLRTMTKMFYGRGSNVGNPPLLSHLNGYGKYVLNDIPVLIKNFQIELGTDVDYIPVTVAPDPAPNYVPTRSTITVTTTPNYARSTVSKFNLKTFSEGGFVNTPEGFV